MKKIIPFDDYNCRLNVGAEFVGSVLPTWGNHALRNGWKLIEIYDDKVQTAEVKDGNKLGGISL